MTEITEIRIDGRGGQGNVIAAYMLAEAGFEAGRHVQAFPNFGPERRGAPVAAFVRISDRPFKRRCQVREPRYVIVQDPTLLHTAGALAVHRDGGVLINSSRTVEELGFNSPVRSTVLPATALAAQFLGRPIPNSALVAALLVLTELLPLEAFEKALAHRFSGETLERNLQLVRKAARSVEAGAWKDHLDAARA
ncbi:MAG TPA: 2-oxoacid:acceptor oxidoreductase family protein [Candidatus Binataceae bacterium]|nr:2-oxoacid:acceptor oxidoreductase family protein [Candidatus Binataceae bacterium]